MKMGPKLRQLRDIKGLSQEDMAERLNMSVNSYGRLERNETAMTLERLDEIAKILGMSIEDLLRFDEQIVFCHVNQGGVVNVSGGTVHTGNAEVYEKEIEHLKAEIDHLRRLSPCWRPKTKRLMAECCVA